MNNNENSNFSAKTEAGTSAPMSEEERLKLAAKLDKELDEFIDSLPKKKYDDGWPEDRWEEEMEKHPFFMTKAPEPGAELHPLYEGLQKLKYDPDENEPEDLALSYKEDGNYNFKYKNYRLAIMAYTEGLKVKCGNPEVEATLYNNRAAAHFFLKNFRSSLKDCELSLKIKPNYIKTLQRAANCCFQTKKYDECTKYCDQILENNKNNKEILELRQKSINAAKIKLRDERKRELSEKKLTLETKNLLQEIKNRKINIEGVLSLEKLEPCFPQLVNNRVFLDENNNLIWPVVFLYPEYKIMDYIQGFNETHCFEQQLEAVFTNFPEWDHEKKYTPKNLVIYYETEKKKIIEVPQKTTLQKAITAQSYVVRGGTPSFIILVKNSKAEQRFLENY